MDHACFSFVDFLDLFWPITFFLCVFSFSHQGEGERSCVVAQLQVSHSTWFQFLDEIVLCVSTFEGDRNDARSFKVNHLHKFDYMEASWWRCTKINMIILWWGGKLCQTKVAWRGLASTTFDVVQKNMPTSLSSKQKSIQ